MKFGWIQICLNGRLNHWLFGQVVVRQWQILLLAIMWLAMLESTIHSWMSYLGGLKWPLEPVSKKSCWYERSLAVQVVEQV